MGRYARGFQWYGGTSSSEHPVPGRNEARGGLRVARPEGEAHGMTYPPFGIGVPALATPAGATATVMGTLVVGLLLLALLAILIGAWRAS
jgi:hypothetical protein